MPYVEKTCPECGAKSTVYEHEEWPKALKLPSGEEVAAHSPEHVEELMAPFRPKDLPPVEERPLEPDGPVAEDWKPESGAEGSP